MILRGGAINVDGIGLITKTSTFSAPKSRTRMNK